MPNRVDPYQPAGDLFLEYEHDHVSNYRRELDLSTGIVTVRYSIGNVEYYRQMFAHADLPVICIRLGCSQKSGLNLRARLSRIEDPDCTLVPSAREADFGLYGEFPEGPRFSITAKLLSAGGEIVPDVHTGGVRFLGATGVILALTIAVTHDGEDPKALAEEQLADVPSEWGELMCDCHPCNQRRKAMNIILIISDTFRYDNLFDRVSMSPRTPELERFAGRSVSLSRLYTSSFPTIPHRTDLTTGRYGWPWYGWQDRLKSGDNHLPVLLSQVGYASQLICDCPHLFRANFNIGFDGAYVLRGQEGDTFFLRMNHPVESVMPLEKTRYGKHFQGRNLPDLARWTNRLWYREEDRFPPRTAALAVEWLEENYEYHPFFLWVDFFDPHEPWDPPEYMVRRYDPDYTGIPMIHPNYGKASDLTPEELKNLRAHYCAEAELVDRWVGRVLQKIDDLGLWDNSIVVFTTDHGMSLGEHNRTGKSNINPGDDRCWPIYPEIAHIPFMIAAPGLEGGRTVDALLQPPDILPTLLELAGVEVNPPDSFHGRSFAPMLRGEPQEPLHKCAISANYLRTKPGEQSMKWTTPVLYTEKWAYAPIGADGKRELYDLETDAYAESNVASDHPEVIAELHSWLLDWLKELNAPQEALAVFEW